MNYSFIINPNSGNNRKKNIIKKLLREFPAGKINIIKTEYPGHAAKIARQELDKQTATIVAVGGDGTVNEIASQLVGSDACLGIIPMGSGNGFARSLDIPLKPRLAVETIFRNKSRRIDVGKVNDKFFFAVSGIGIDAYIANRFQESKIRGAVPYFIASLKEFFSYPFPEFSINSGAKVMAVKPLLVTIANASQFGNDAVIAPQADLNDGLLDICVMQKLTLWGFVKAAQKMFSGKINQDPSYSAFTSKKIEITSKNSEINYHIDGEPHKTADSLTFEIIPNALNVITN